MDISNIKSDQASPDLGIQIGDKDANNKMIEYLNLRCPFCKKWFEESYEVLDEALSAKKIQRVIKLFNKEKPSLQRGNVMHEFVDFSNPDDFLPTLKKILDTQDEWSELELDEVAAYAENNLGLTRQSNDKLLQEIVEEANSANVIFVPTIILGKHIFDENITEEELKQLINKHAQGCDKSV